MPISDNQPFVGELFPDGVKPLSGGDIKNPMYFYTNINNLRHFGSLDAVVSRDCFQTPNFDDSFGSLISGGLLLAGRSLSASIFETFRQDVNPVVLEFDLHESRSLRGFIVGDETVARPIVGNLPHGDEIRLLVVLGYLPMSLVRRIVFRSKPEMVDFQALKFKGLEFDESKFTVDPSLFSGDYLPDMSLVQELSSSLGNDLSHALRGTVLQRDRLRGSLLAASGGLALSHGISLDVNFDKGILQLFGRLRNIREYSFSDECVAIGLELGDLLRPLGLFLEANLCALPSDPTPFPYWDDCMRSFKQGTFESFDSETIGGVGTEALCDRIAYECILTGLRDELSGQFRPVEFLSAFLDRFNELAPQRLPETRLAEFEILRKRYQDGVGLVARVVNQYEKASDVLKNWQGRFYSLKSFMTFATAYSPDSYSDLESRLGKYVLTPYEKRLVWSMYGMLNGVGPLGESIKQRKDLLTLTELVVHSYGSTSELSDLSDELEENFAQIMREQVVNPARISQDGVAVVNLWSKVGFGLSFKITDTVEPIRLAVLKQLKGANENLGIKGLILSSIPVPERYTCFVTEVDQWLSIDHAGQGLRIKHKRPSISTKRMWDNWDLYVSEFLQRPEVFGRQPKEHLDLWKMILRGDYPPPGDLERPRRKPTVRKKGTKKS